MWWKVTGVLPPNSRVYTTYKIPTAGTSTEISSNNTSCTSLGDDALKAYFHNSLNSSFATLRHQHERKIDPLRSPRLCMFGGFINPVLECFSIASPTGSSPGLEGPVASLISPPSVHSSQMLKCVTEAYFDRPSNQLFAPLLPPLEGTVAPLRFPSFGRFLNIR